MQEWDYIVLILEQTLSFWDNIEPRQVVILVLKIYHINHQENF